VAGDAQLVPENLHVLDISEEQSHSVLAEQSLGGIFAALKPGCCPDKRKSDSG